MSGRTLEPSHILKTVERLERRIAERFPTSGLLSICGDLVAIARRAEVRASWLSAPIWPLRLAIASLLALGISAVVVFAPETTVTVGKIRLFDLLQAIEAGVNDLLLMGAGIFFLATWERRVKRTRALRAIHELRSLAHVVDMHQLTKDPERAFGRVESTPSSPVTNLNSGQLSRYLDYCSEMLSLISKIAAIYAEHLDDPVVLNAVNEIEALTSGFSRKVWQKILIVSGAGAELRRAGVPE